MRSRMAQDLHNKWRTRNRNGALTNVAMKDGPVNTVRFFEAFDFTSVAETRLQAHKPAVTDTVMKS